MINLQELQEIQLDALREVANIGAGHAATALSQLTKSRIMISVPRLQIVPLEETADLLSDPEEVIAAVLMNMLGDLNGQTLLVFPRASALQLASILLHRPAQDTLVFGELEQSAIKEAGNILSAAYMNALSDFMGMVLLPSVPALAIDLCAAVLTTTHTQVGGAHDYVFSIETQFMMDHKVESIRGHFLLMPDLPALQKILEKIRLD